MIPVPVTSESYLYRRENRYRPNRQRSGVFSLVEGSAHVALCWSAAILLAPEASNYHRDLSRSELFGLAKFWDKVPNMQHTYLGFQVNLRSIYVESASSMDNIAAVLTHSRHARSASERLPVALRATPGVIERRSAVLVPG
jgi:hypothetical protein